MDKKRSSSHPPSNSAPNTENYDPIDHPFVPEPSSVDDNPNDKKPSTSNKNTNIENYDPIDHPFTPKASSKPPMKESDLAPERDNFPILSLIFAIFVPVVGIVLSIVGLKKKDKNKTKYIRSLIVSVAIQILLIIGTILLVVNYDKLLINFVYKPDKIYGTWTCYDSRTEAVSTAHINRDQTFTIDDKSGTFSITNTVIYNDAELSDFRKAGFKVVEYEAFGVSLSTSRAPYRFVVLLPDNILTILNMDSSTGYVCEIVDQSNNQAKR